MTVFMYANLHCFFAIVKWRPLSLYCEVFMNTTTHSSVSTTSQDWGATLLRVSLGLMWVTHALLKIVAYTLPGTAQFFGSVGLPGFMVYPVVAMELVGGAALLLGFYGRQVSLLLAPILLVAAWVHLPNGWVFTNPKGGWEYPVFLLAATMAHWLLGDGKLALRRSRLFVPA
jgi:putative oxidoreductase